MSRGQNVWYDLMTHDLAAAKAFYTEAIGWKTEQWSDAPPDAPPYSMWKADSGTLGGVMPLPEEAKKMGVPPHWIAYTTVDDVDATIEQVKSLGGELLAPAFDIPKVGRIGMLKDPQGAAFAVITLESDMEYPGDDALGRFSWSELNTTDWEAAWKFYGPLFGWEERGKMEMGPGQTYFMWNTANTQTKGGMSNMAEQMKMPPHWLHYVTVADMDATIARIKSHGGKVLNGPMDIPGDDVIAQCMDPQGAAFAIYAKKK